MAEPLILLDDARSAGASDARLYRAPVHIVVARRADEVGPALERIAELAEQGFDMAGYLAYEAGLALEPRLAGLAAARTGAAGPLVWFGAFRGWETIAAGDMPGWLAAHAAAGPAGIGPAEPQVSPGGYARAFAELRQAIADGDIYQANLTIPLKASWNGDPLALYAAIRPAAPIRLRRVSSVMMNPLLSRGLEDQKLLQTGQVSTGQLRLGTVVVDGSLQFVEGGSEIGRASCRGRV